MRDDDPRDEKARAEADEKAWREIVANYGEAPAVPDPEAFRLELYDDRFVPPPLPPAPEVSPERRFAWVVLVCAPILLLVLALAHFVLPTTVTAGLGLASLAAFGYLVGTMSRDPRDPDDDGARL